jgi:hypothetical protein
MPQIWLVFKAMAMLSKGSIIHLWKLFVIEIESKGDEVVNRFIIVLLD